MHPTSETRRLCFLAIIYFPVFLAGDTGRNLQKRWLPSSLLRLQVEPIIVLPGRYNA